MTRLTPAAQFLSSPFEYPARFLPSLNGLSIPLTKWVECVNLGTYSGGLKEQVAFELKWSFEFFVSQME